MITAKQRARLRAIANNIDTILYIGKGGIVPATIDEAADALKAREIIKVKVQENSPISSKEAAAELSEKTGSDVVQVIGNRFVLYKENRENPRIILN